MKNILITGKESYIGKNAKAWLEKEENLYNIKEVETRNEEWKNTNFSDYDVVLHVAGIAHVSANPKLKELYYKVNRDLAIEVAQKAKKEGVKQFIFMSSMIIYGMDAKIGEEKIIDKDTKPKASDFYGQSKLEADLEIQKLSDENFRVVIVRTPMVYGPNCKGNFPKLKKIAKISPIFPNIENNRSMIYIDNLCEFFKQIIDNEENGIFYPQNRQYISTKEIIRILAEEQGKKIHFINLFNPIIKFLSKYVNTINKVFGSKVYSQELSRDFKYIVIENEESIRRSI